jgi:hypothetical protein
MRKKDALQPDRKLVSCESAALLRIRVIFVSMKFQGLYVLLHHHPPIFHKSRILDFQISRADFKIMDKIQYMQAAIIPIFVFQQWVS